jgi:uncharacterized protein YecT (DUF1311 family)
MKAIVFLLFLFVASLLHGQDKPKQEDNCCCTTYDTNACLTKVIKKLDVDLNAAYEEAMKRSIHPDKLRAAERLWLRYRDSQCDYESKEYEGGTIAGQIGGFCITRLTRQRIDHLKLIVEEQGH